MAEAAEEAAELKKMDQYTRAFYAPPVKARNTARAKIQTLKKNQGRCKKVVLEGPSRGFDVRRARRCRGRGRAKPAADNFLTAGSTCHGWSGRNCRWDFWEIGIWREVRMSSGALSPSSTSAPGTGDKTTLLSLRGRFIPQTRPGNGHIQNVVKEYIENARKAANDAEARAQVGQTLFLRRKERASSMPIFDDCGNEAGPSSSSRSPSYHPSLPASSHSSMPELGPISETEEDDMHPEFWSHPGNRYEEGADWNEYGRANRTPTPY
ncbi:hypothetical protein BDZ89DRAFT_1050087 [Hymenopellis radicata]|nr:hypothetical protein BDZ89DRAFT_1050087 [Hymenopellis radicata]